MNVSNFVKHFAAIAYGAIACIVLFSIAVSVRTDEPKAVFNMQKAICIGGPIDGQYAPVEAGSNEQFISTSPLRPLGTTYTRQQISINGETTLFFYVSEEIKIGAAIHQVFARYSRKGK